ncbi:MAG: acetyltransferase [Oxalobacter sp.]|nr:MAG: acetyltransferase [Oxalobacter sp.]
MSGDAILLLGAGGHARSCVDVIEQEGRFRIAGFVGTANEVGTTQLGYPVLGSDADLPSLLQKFKRVLVTVGQVKSPDVRMHLFAMARAHQCELPAIISPHAYVSRHAQIGAGTVVIHGALVNPNARVGENCILNTGAVVDHDAIVGDHCHISTTAVLNGGVIVGAGSFVGSNACVRQDIRIGERCLIGMGQRVVADCADGTWLPPRKEKA